MPIANGRLAMARAASDDMSWSSANDCLAAGAVAAVAADLRADVQLP